MYFYEYTILLKNDLTSGMPNYFGSIQDSHTNEWRCACEFHFSLIVQISEKDFEENVMNISYFLP